MKVAPLFAIIVCAAVSSCTPTWLPPRDAWLARHFVIMEDFEKTAYTGLRPEGKGRFQTLFWEVRDPGAQDIFEERMALISKAFRRENSARPWDTDRGRIYLLNGPPLEIIYGESLKTVSAPVSADAFEEAVDGISMESWLYLFENVFIVYRFFFRPPNEWRIGPGTYNDVLLRDLEARSREEFFGIPDIETYRIELEHLAAEKKMNPR